MPGKGRDPEVSGRGRAVHAECGHVGEVEIVLDQEPATRALAELSAQVRRQLGYPVSIQHSKSYRKGRTAKVERYIQTLRRRASTLIEQIEDSAEISISDDHALRAWGLRHSAFLLNRFHFHASLRATPFRILHGHDYGGRLMRFGEMAYGLKKPNRKGGAIWLQGVWLGKDAQDQDVL